MTGVRLRNLVSTLSRTNSAAVLVTTLSLTGMGLFTGIVTARALGPEGRGALALITYWPALLGAVVDLSLVELTTLRTARRPEGLAAVLLAGVGIAAAGSVIGVLGGWLALPHLLREDQLHLLPAAEVCLLYIPAFLFGSLPMGALHGLQRFHAAAAVRLVTGVTYLGAVSALALMGLATPTRFAWLLLGSTALPFALGLALLTGNLRRSLRRPVDLGGVVADGARLQGTRLVTVLGGIEDRAIANFTLSQAGIGWYQVPAALNYVLPGIPQAIGQLLFARYPATPVERRPQVVLSAYVRALTLTAGAAFLAAPLLPFLIPVAYGPDFGPAVAPAVVVVLGAMFAAGSVILQSACRAKMHVGVCIAAEVAAGSAMALAAWPLTQMFDLTGLALSYVVGRATSFACMAIVAPSRLGMSRSELVPGSAKFRSQLAIELKTLVALVRAPPSVAPSANGDAG